MAACWHCGCESLDGSAACPANDCPVGGLVIGSPEYVTAFTAWQRGERPWLPRPAEATTP